MDSDVAEKMEEKGKPEALIPAFKLNRVLNQDQNGRRVTFLGKIDGKEALLTAERAAFPSDEETLQAFHAALSNIKTLGDNDIYRWYLASSGTATGAPPDLKLNLIYPCTGKHITKYSPQEVRMVTETPEIYAKSVRPYMQKMRDEGRLNWIFNILEGRAEQEDVQLREAGPEGADEGFLLAPDLNWDRKTLKSMHLLALVYRRDIWSLRDLKKHHISWLKHMRTLVLDATVKLYQGSIERDQIKLYVHYQPTYYHFHIHVVHVMCEATNTQSVGKAFSLDNIISQLENMAGSFDASMAEVDLTYYIGTASDLWAEVFAPLKAAKG